METKYYGGEIDARIARLTQKCTHHRGTEGQTIEAHKCPFCRSEDIERMGTMPLEKGTGDLFRCRDCEKTWHRHILALKYEEVEIDHG